MTATSASRGGSARAGTLVGRIITLRHLAFRPGRG
jgi:hypothetical protein